MTEPDYTIDAAQDGEIDLGSSHYARWYGWWPDDLPQNRALYNVPDGEPMPHVERAGLIIRHRIASDAGLRPLGNTGWCEGAITFDLPECRHLANDDHRWQVISLDPIHVAPSILCACGDHGHIINGRWQA